MPKRKLGGQLYRARLRINFDIFIQVGEEEGGEDVVLKIAENAWRENADRWLRDGCLGPGFEVKKIDSARGVPREDREQLTFGTSFGSFHAGFSVEEALGLVDIPDDDEHDE